MPPIRRQIVSSPVTRGRCPEGAEGEGHESDRISIDNHGVALPLPASPVRRGRRMMSQRFARVTAAFSRRLAPGTERVSSIASFTLWLMPSKQGVKIIAVGAIVATA